MDRTVFVIKSEKGFLQDVEKYTYAVDKAVQFASFDTATNKLKTVSGYLNTQCWITEETVPFPRKNSLLESSF